MIVQVTKYDLKTLLSRPSLSPVHTIRETDDGFEAVSIHPQGEEVVISDPVPIKIEDAVNSNLTYHHTVKRIDPFINERIGDDNSLDFIRLVQLLYYTGQKRSWPWLDQIVGFYRNEYEAVTTLTELSSE